VELAFAETESSLVSAYIDALYAKMSVPSSYFFPKANQTSQIITTVKFSVYDAVSTPAKLVVEFKTNNATLGVNPVGSAELTQVQ
jgi:hypothetical protein